MEGNASTGLGGGISVPGVAGSSIVDLGDLNKDNKVEIVISLRDQMRMLAFVNKGNETFSP
ncbi:MAG: hypothetical protein GYA55_03155 [SAR324 cluster bacterium]|uniref:VCBS repeat-containing protein n=1 Tax=SAR324 cluster bacterium TaxID=2024889 RepID=A0A7X9IJK1_9DELT|nr:hypothetical protein [SAR324 cluster bacterium]